VKHYQLTKQVGKGTYGNVYLALNRLNGSQVAVKRMKFSDPKVGIPSTALREASILREIDHPNIVELIDIVMQSRDEL